jgi:hypothetical protein
VEKTVRAMQTGLTGFCLQYPEAVAGFLSQNQSPCAFPSHCSHCLHWGGADEAGQTEEHKTSKKASLDRRVRQ